MVLIYVFDIDDTLYEMETFSYDDLEFSQRLKNNINNIPDYIPKYILTNAGYIHANKVLEKLNIKNDFKLIFSSTSIPQLKPHPAAYKYAISTIMENENINDSRDINILFFDDLFGNLVGAKYYNWRTCWINKFKEYSGGLTKKQHADYEFKDINEALEYMNKMNDKVCNFNHKQLI